MKSIAMVAAGSLALVACGSSDDSGSGGSIVISGSSTVEPISIKVAEAFQQDNPDVDVSVSGPGTGDGFQLFCEGESDISDASRQIKDEEVALCEESGVEYVELKIAFDGIAVMKNPANEAVSCLTFEDLYSLIGPEAQGVDNWSGAAAVAGELGSTTEFPDETLSVVGPGPESGTYDSFIEIALEGVGEVRAEEGAISEDDAATTRSDYNASADDNAIIEGIKADAGSLGWVGFAFAEENEGDVAEIEVDGGEGCTSPTSETIADGSYPVSRGLYIYVNTATAQDSEALQSFVDLYLGDAYEASVTQAFGESGYVVLPDDQLAETVSAWEAVG